MTRLAALTRDLRLARFLERPNRFVVRCSLDGDELATAHLPNPGRMWELLLPGARLWLSPRSAMPAPAAPRTTRFTVLAVQRDDEPIFLHTQATNDVARRLIDQDRIPGLEGTRVVRSEVGHGHSRFDLLLRRGGREVLGEVKSVTLFGGGVAMFPDAPTCRGRRHLLELAEASRPGARPLVLFLVHTRTARHFLPDYHTDLDFARTLLAVRDRLEVVAAAVGWRPALGMPRRARRLDIDWSYLRQEAQDRGAYLLVMQLDQTKRLGVGKLGRLRFAAGYWIYVGSAMSGLTARVERHLRKRKRMHWHVDYLRQAASQVWALPIRSSERQECTIARTLAQRWQAGPAGFGSSDCGCSTHLFFRPRPPLEDPEFHALLQRHRMARPM